MELQMNIFLNCILKRIYKCVIEFKTKKYCKLQNIGSNLYIHKNNSFRLHDFPRSWFLPESP